MNSQNEVKSEKKRKLKTLMKLSTPSPLIRGMSPLRQGDFIEVFLPNPPSALGAATPFEKGESGFEKID
jgi:hypothetical protein